MKGLNTPGNWAFFAERAFPNNNIDFDDYERALMQAKSARDCAKELQALNLWQMAGPTNIGGRITDIEMPINDTNTIYIAAASGGIFKTKNKGKTWKPMFDDQLSLSIGDIGISKSNPEILYVGTGEANAGGGSITYDGIGIFKSTDEGENWTHIGLEKTRNIGRIIVHPSNPDIVYAAAMGSLFANNQERGVFKSIDGGKSWQQSLYISDSTGCVDLAIHPSAPNIVYAAMWERIRRPNKRQYGGNSCGIYRSVDNGNTWIELTNGLPNEDIGRIGLALAESEPNVLYSIYANEEGYFKGIYKTEDGGSKWKKCRDAPLKEIYMSYGWWFGNIRVNPNNADEVYALGLDIWKSKNGGQNWKNVSWQNVHYDQHAMFIHPKNSDLVVLGNDGGAYLSENAAKKWQHLDNLPITQFYTCEIDSQNPDALYGGSQDNGIIRTTTGKIDDWELLVDGDGFCVIVDPNDNEMLYTAYQYGSLIRSPDGGISFFEGTSGIEEKDRRNWHTPIILDNNNNNILYYGTSRLYKSEDRAASWTVISPELSKISNDANNNNMAYGTITSIAIAPSNSDVLYIGTDDGNVWRNSNQHNNWDDLTVGLPKRWVTSIAVNPNDAQEVYISFSGYRQAEYLPHLFKTNDGGQQWIDIAGDLPEAPINKILIHPLNDKILYVATDVGVFFSENDGNTWQMLGSNLPNVPISDLDIDSNSGILAAATYGRSLYIYQLYTNNVAISDSLMRE
ncbi:MAG: VPS10 domain-containing protein [Chitinophagales bacterium]